MYTSTTGKGVDNARIKLKALSECEADVEAILQKLDELQLYDCALSLKDVAKVLNLSKTRIRQIEQKALQKIKGRLEKSA